MAHRVRPSSQGGDRSRGRSLAETLRAGNNRYGDMASMGPEAPYMTEDETYDEASGPKKTTRRPVEGEWEPYTVMDRFNEFKGYNK